MIADCYNTSLLQPVPLSTYYCNALWQYIFIAVYLLVALLSLYPTPSLLRYQRRTRDSGFRIGNRSCSSFAFYLVRKDCLLVLKGSIDITQDLLLSDSRLSSSSTFSVFLSFYLKYCNSQGSQIEEDSKGSLVLKFLSLMKSRLYQGFCHTWKCQSRTLKSFWPVNPETKESTRFLLTSWACCLNISR